jgi:hypothetical protein
VRNVVTALIVVGISTTVGGQTGPRDFARGIEVRTDAGGAIFRVMLPRDVYLVTTQPGLDDLRVFNANGTPVPTSIRQVAPPAPGEEELVSVPVFPLYTRAAAGLGTAAQVKIDREGAVVEVSGNAASGETLTSYLIDASALKEALGGIALDWQAPADASFLGHVRVEGSDDLNRWRTLQASAAIAQMRQGSFTISQRDIELSGARAKYLRVWWPTELRAATLVAARVRPQRSAPPVEPRWEFLTPTPISGSPGAASYDTGGRFPVERIDVEFADATDAASVTIRSRADAADDLRVRHSGLFYSLAESDTRLTNAPAVVARTVDRYWNMETERDGGWGGRPPRLKVGWYPQELLFVARGDGPYTLAYGSGRVGRDDTPIDAVLANLDEESRQRIREATLGAPYDLGGRDVLAAPRSWRREVLWAVLIGAVLVLGVFALRLFRESSAASTPPGERM